MNRPPCLIGSSRNGKTNASTRMADDDHSFTIRNVARNGRYELTSKTGSAWPTLCRSIARTNEGMFWTSFVRRQMDWRRITIEP